MTLVARTLVTLPALCDYTAASIARKKATAPYRSHSPNKYEAGPTH